MHKLSIGIALAACAFAGSLAAQPKPRVGGVEPRVPPPAPGQVAPPLGIAKPGPAVQRPPVPVLRHAFSRTPARRLEIVNAARAGFGLPPTTLAAMKLDRPALTRLTPRHPANDKAILNLNRPVSVYLLGDTGRVDFKAKDDADGLMSNASMSYAWMWFTGIEKKLHVLACAVAATGATSFTFFTSSSSGMTHAVTKPDADGYVYFAFRNSDADFEVSFVPILGGEPTLFGCELDPAE